MTWLLSTIGNEGFTPFVSHATYIAEEAKPNSGRNEDAHHNGACTTQPQLGGGGDALPLALRLFVRFAPRSTLR